MLTRMDPFLEIDRLAERFFGPAARSTILRMDAYRDGDYFYAAFDLPGVDPDSIECTVERNVLTVRAQRRRPGGDGVELLAAERPMGVFSRQLLLDDTLDTTGWRPATTPVCSPYGSRLPSRPSRAGCRSASPTTDHDRSSPDPGGVRRHHATDAAALVVNTPLPARPHRNNWTYQSTSCETGENFLRAPARPPGAELRTFLTCPDPSRPCHPLGRLASPSPGGPASSPRRGCATGGCPSTPAPRTGATSPAGSPGATPASSTRCAPRSSTSTRTPARWSPRWTHGPAGR